MSDARPPVSAIAIARAASLPRTSRDRRLFFAAKRVFDVGLSLLFLPMLVVIALALLVANPLLNRGPLLYTQTRMGRHCRPFTAIKFRSMLPAAGAVRGADDPLEQERITRLGRVLRKSRIDELPQVINVLRGEMSLIGPRPDVLAHAEEFVALVPGYRERHAIRPGISGLAQVEIGYAEGIEATRRKVRADLYYIAHLGLAMEAYIFIRTIQTVLGRRGL